MRKGKACERMYSEDKWHVRAAKGAVASGKGLESTPVECSRWWWSSSLDYEVHYTVDRYRGYHNLSVQNHCISTHVATHIRIYAAIGVCERDEVQYILTLFPW